MSNQYLQTRFETQPKGDQHVFPGPRCKQVDAIVARWKLMPLLMQVHSSGMRMCWEPL